MKGKRRRFERPRKGKGKQNLETPNPEKEANKDRLSNVNKLVTLVTSIVSLVSTIATSSAKFWEWVQKHWPQQ
jgi:hypothetical protein